MKLTIYHNPRCRVSRQVLNSIMEEKHDVEIIQYLKDSPDEKELSILLQKLNMQPMQIIRKNETLYKQKLKGKNFTNAEWIKILSENPVLIERPIVVKEYKAIICRPPEKIKDLL